jgi:hypothetical protein
MERTVLLLGHCVRPYQHRVGRDNMAHQLMTAPPVTSDHRHAALPRRARAALSILRAYQVTDVAERERAIETHFESFPIPSSAVACRLPG